MKAKLLLLVFLTPFIFYAQTQIGADIDGEAADDHSGYCVSLSSDGTIVAIGANVNDANGDQSGHVRIYQNNSGVWTQLGDDIDGVASKDQFGSSISLSSDGSKVAIGAPFNDGNGDRAGHVQIFENISNVWTQIGTDIEGEAAVDNFGHSVSLSSDGNIVAIGAQRNDVNTGNVYNSTGHVRVYQNISGVWIQIGTDIDGEAEGDSSGESVSLSSDGSIVAIGAPENDGNGDSAGHVRVYQNISDIWTQIGDDIDGEAAYDNLGESVSLSSDGSIVAIGAPNNDNYSGHVRVYKNDNGTWIQIGDDIDGEAENDDSGESVSLSSDGSVVAIGAPGNSNSSGHVRVYQNISGDWTQISTDIDGESTFSYSGFSVSLSSDAKTVAIGTYGGGVNYSGHVSVYDLSALLSLEDNEIANSFNIYPNPATELLQLTLNSDLELQVVKIYNTLGQEILRSEEKSLDISNLSTGFYYVEITTTKGKGVKKLMVK